MNTLQTTLWIFGWYAMALVALWWIGILVTVTAKQIITHYFSTKKAYAQALVEMEAPGHLVEMVEEIAKKYNDTIVGK